jgi:hypothetical protein
MSYFKEIPNLKYTANFPDQSFNTDTVDAKNLFRRAKLREDIANAATAFTYYQIKDKERPDILAKKFYNDEELDWVILITNNITDLTEQWPLDNDTLYKHLIDKYGSEEALEKINRYLTAETKDAYNRLLIPKDLIIDQNLVKPDPFITQQNSNNYALTAFPLINDTSITVNLNQIVQVYNRDAQITVNHLVTDIIVSPVVIGQSNSTLYIPSRDTPTTSIKINNDLANWASSWGGTLPIGTRVGSDVVVSINDVIGTTGVPIPNYLYKVENINNTPVFSFTPVKP